MARAVVGSELEKHDLGRNLGTWVSWLVVPRPPGRCEDMDPELSQEAALLWLLSFLWLLPLSRTAPEGMTVPLIDFHPDWGRA